MSPLPNPSATKGLFGFLRPESAREAHETLLISEQLAGLQIEGVKSGSGNCGCGGTEGSAANDQGQLAAVAGYPVWKSPELRSLAKAAGHAQALLRAYDLFGEDLPAQLSGSFTFVVIDTARQEAFAGVDRVARLPLYYGETDGLIWFGSNPLALPAAQAELDP